MADETEIEEFENSFLEKIPDPYKVLFCGGVAGSVAKTVTAPLSRITILFQVNSLVKAGAKKRPEFARGLVPAFRKIIEREGFTAFWKGNLTSICHRFPYSGINFLLFDHFKPIIAKARQKDSSETPFTRFLAGASAGALAATVCYPIDLVRTRLTTQRYEVYYRGIVHAFQRIVQEEGVMGLYRGLGTTLLVAVPNLAISLMSYHSLKDHIIQLRSFGETFRRVSYDEEKEVVVVEPNVLGTLLCGSFSGIFSSLVTFPIDVIRRRMQMEGLMEHKGAVPPHGPLDELQWIVRKEGVKGLYRGLSAELLKVIPMVGTTFLTYESMKNLLNVH